MRTILPAILVVLALVAHAAAATKVKGTLAGDYVLQGVTAHGRVVPATTTNGKFRLVFPGTTGRGASLQIVRTDGRYFGPVVLKRGNGRAYTNLSGKPLNLKTLQVLEGFAAPKRAPGKAIDKTRFAAADSSGAPLGAGKLGLVTSDALRAGWLARDEAAPGDENTETDGDGIPNAYDADDDGDGTLDSVDPDTAATAAVHSGLHLRFDQALNVNASSVTTEAIDAVLAGDNFFTMIFWFFRFEPPVFESSDISGAHVDCFDLPYCRPADGTATISGVTESGPDLPRGEPWRSYRPDGSAFPNLEKLVREYDPDHPAWEMSIQPHAGTGALRPGDSYNVTFATAAGDVTIPASLSAYFVTVPAVASYDAGAGPVAVSYPVDGATPGTSQGNPLLLTGGQLTLTFWRPQRPAIPGAETGEYTDMGHLHYGIPLYIEGAGTQFGCPEDYSNLSETLATGWTSDDTVAVELFPLTDASTDAAPDASRTLSFTFDLASCLTRHGLDPSGRVVELPLTAIGEPSQGGVDSATQTIVVQLPS